jgi:hypothetical protein
VGFQIRSTRIKGKYLEKEYDRLLPDPYQFTIHLLLSFFDLQPMKLKQIPFSEVNISFIGFWKWKHGNNRVHVTPPFDLTLSQLNSVHAVTPCFLKFQFIIFLKSKNGYPKWSLLYGFTTKILCAFLSFHECYMSLMSLLFHSPNPFSFYAIQPRNLKKMVHLHSPVYHMFVT